MVWVMVCWLCYRYSNSVVLSVMVTSKSFSEYWTALTYLRHLLTGFIVTCLDADIAFASVIFTNHDVICLLVFLKAAFYHISCLLASLTQFLITFLHVTFMQTIYKFTRNLILVSSKKLFVQQIGASGHIEWSKSYGFKVNPDKNKSIIIRSSLVSKIDYQSLPLSSSTIY